MHTQLTVVEIVDQNEWRARDRVDVEANLFINGFLRIMREVLLDGVIDTGERSFGNSGAESLGALRDEGLELLNVRSGSNDTSHECFDLRPDMKPVISAWY